MAALTQAPAPDRAVDVKIAEARVLTSQLTGDAQRDAAVFSAGPQAYQQPSNPCKRTNRHNSHRGISFPNNPRRATSLRNSRKVTSHPRVTPQDPHPIASPPATPGPRAPPAEKPAPSSKPSTTIRNSAPPPSSKCTPGGGEEPSVIPSAKILEIRLNTVVGKNVGAFHISTRQGLYLDLAPDSASADDGCAAVESLRKQLGLSE